MGPERRQRVLAALVAGGPDGVSGPGLARLLGCSRAAVHRHVDALRRGGVDIEAGRRGYRLAGAPDLVVPALVEPRLEPPVTGPVVWRDEVTSTNDEAVLRAREGAPEGLVVGADHQTAGRGRRGRAWTERRGEGLLVSVLLRPEVAPSEAGLLPIVVALAVVDALAATGLDDPGIVWPNDVLAGGRKVGGILCELSGDQERVAWAVAGIGINVRGAPQLEGARWPAGSLADVGSPPRRADLLASLLVALARRYRRWTADGAAPALADYRRHDLLADRQVELVIGAERLTGTAAGLDELGRLRLRVAGGERLIAAGEVVRVAEVTSRSDEPPGVASDARSPI